MFAKRVGGWLHWTHIREVLGSYPGADQSDWDFFVVFLSHQGKCLVKFSVLLSICPLFVKSSGDLAGHVMYGDPFPIHLEGNCSSKDVRIMLAKCGGARHNTT